MARKGDRNRRNLRQWERLWRGRDSFRLATQLSLSWTAQCAGLCRLTDLEADRRLQWRWAGREQLYVSDPFDPERRHWELERVVHYHGPTWTFRLYENSLLLHIVGLCPDDAWTLLCVFEGSIRLVPPEVCDVAAVDR